MQDLAERLAPLGLRPSDASTLVVLLSNPGLVQKEVGNILGIASGNFAPMVSKLAQGGYLTRAAADGRSVRLTLTSKGRSTARKALRTMEQHDRQLLAQIPEGLRVTFSEALTAVAFPVSDG